MPLFLMLSGFSLTVVYGRKRYKSVNLCCSETNDLEDQTTNEKLLKDSSNDSQDLNSLNISGFYQNRCARVIPVYYLTMLLTIPYSLAGFGVMSPDDLYAPQTIIVNIIPVSTLFSFTLGGPLDGVAWTVCTLCVFWVFFPYFLTQYQGLTDSQLVSKIVAMFYWQLVLLIVGVLGILAVGGNFWVAFATGTMNPITRIPLFIMGICAGLLCVRHPIAAEMSDKDPDPLPWPKPYISLFPCGTSTSGATDWTALTRQVSLNLLFLTLFWAAIDSFIYDIIGAVFLQAIVPYAQLTVVVGLTRDCSVTNTVYNFLVHPVNLWLGKISMTIYLLHYVFIMYVCWIVYGHSLTWCDAMDKDADCDDFNDARVMPTWGIPAVIVTTLITSPIIYSYFEEPMRKFMQVQKK